LLRNIRGLLDAETNSHLDKAFIDEKAAAVSALRNDRKQMELRAGAKKGFEINSRVSSLLQVYSSLTF
jgi:hypothetical protein